MPNRSLIRATLHVCLAATLALALAGCSSQKHVTAPVVTAPAGPAATSPQGAVQRLVWALESRDFASYDALLTDDYAFVFATSDSAGNHFPDRSLDRPLEETSMQHLLVGGGAQPPASSITAAIDSPLVSQPDTRPGRNPGWHRSIRTRLTVQFTIDQGGSPDVESVTGYALFYLVRGDSAYFLPGSGARPDSTRWFVSRWNDESSTYGGLPGVHADPTRSSTLGQIKFDYLVSASPRR